MHKFNPNMHDHSGAPDPKNIVAYDVSLKEKKQIAERTYAFTFEKPKELKFRAGQHIRMTLINPPETDNDGDSRFFSMVSTPQEKDLVFAMRMRDTAFKRTLGKMQIGDKVKIQMRLDNPHGSFSLHEDASKPAIFIVGGIGIVPVFSMIKDAIERKLPHQMFLFYSNRRPEDAPFLQELKQLAKQHTALRLIVTMTEPDKSVKSWQGETGKIDILLIKKYINNFESSIYYVSGLSDMVCAMKTQLTKSGIDENSIRAEEFTGFNLNEMHGTMMHGDSAPKGKSHFLFIAIGLIITAVVVFHLFAATSIFKNGLSFTNPFLYLMLGLMVIIIPLKFKHIKSLTQTIKSEEVNI